MKSFLIGDGPQPIARELFEQFKFRGRYVERPKQNRQLGTRTPKRNDANRESILDFGNGRRRRI